MILLIKPPPADNPFSLDMALKNEPLELEYIGGMLKEQNIPYYIYEASLNKLTLEEVLAFYKPKAVAITGYITQEYTVKSYAGRIKAYNKNIVIIVGGSHAQLNYKNFFTDDISYICRSDNIYAILEVLAFENTYDCLALQKKEISEIDGLCYKQNKVWNVNPVRPFDINTLPFPDRSQCEQNSSQYRYLDVCPVALIKTSSSCPYSCSFCYGRLLNNAYYCQRDLNKIIEEIKSIKSPNIQITDDDFLFDKDRLKQFINLIKLNNIKKTFICYGRADFISKEKELVKQLVEIGFKYFMVGLEAVNNFALDSYKKRTSLDMNIASINYLKSLNAKTVGLFIVDINFRRCDFRNMRKFIKDNQLYYVGISLFTPIPGTELYEMYKDKLITKDLEKWDFMHLVVPPVNMSRFGFYFEYYLLVLYLFKIAEKQGIYSFIKLSDYKTVFLRLLFPWAFGEK